eukprot:Skav231844  [mRNA]  locus=scaffold2215:305952:307056:+ [translate_table: standard]
MTPKHVGPTSIPCVIHQTWNTHQLSDDQQRCVDTWKQMNPTCQHKLWNATEIAALSREKSPDLLWPIWDGLTPVERADVFGYLVLWDQGGYYSDLDVVCQKPIADFPDVNMIVGYEAGRRLEEFDRRSVSFARVEQFETWFFASAPGSPLLLRAMEIVKEKFLWKVQDNMDLTGPGSFSDAVHEFLATTSDDHGISLELHRKSNYSRNLTFPSEKVYRSGDWKLWLLASQRVSTRGYAAGDDPAPGILEHQFAGTWRH